MDDVNLADFPADRVKTVYVYVVHAEVCSKQIFVVARHLDALNMRPEIALCDTAEPFVVNLICDSYDASILR